MIDVMINGMGRIGRALYRTIVKNFSADVQVVAVNDPNLNINQLVYLLNYDSTGQGLKGEVTVDTEDSILYQSTKTYLYNISDISSIPIGELGQIYVFDCTGKNTTIEVLSEYLNAGAVKVILCCPPATNEIPQIVYGVNHENLSASDNIISISSCSNQAIASLLKPFIGTYEIDNCIAKVIRSYTNDQNLMDNVDSQIERGRAAAVNIIPTTVTGNGKLIGAIIPSLNGKVRAQAFRTPTILGGAIDLTINLSGTSLAKDEVDNLMTTYSQGNDNMDYSNDKLVSSDVIGNPSAVLYLSTYTLVVGNTINIVGLYDNENGFAAQAVRTAIYMNTLF